MIKSFEDLEVYKDSKKLFGNLLEVTRSFPREGNFLGQQILRASNSIHANIAEGYAKSELDFKRYLSVSLGSSNELISHFDDALKAGYVNKTTYSQLANQCNTIGKKLYRLREKWKKS